VPPRASDDPEEEQIFRDLWEDETQREIVVESLKDDYEVRMGRPAGLWGIDSGRSEAGVCAEGHRRISRVSIGTSGNTSSRRLGE
jgi:hypothetical protein